MGKFSVDGDILDGRRYGNPIQPVSAGHPSWQRQELNEKAGCAFGGRIIDFCVGILLSD